MIGLSLCTSVGTTPLGLYLRYAGSYCSFLKRSTRLVSHDRPFSKSVVRTFCVQIELWPVKSSMAFPVHFVRRQDAYRCRLILKQFDEPISGRAVASLFVGQGLCSRPARSVRTLPSAKKQLRGELGL